MPQDSPRRLRIVTGPDEGRVFDMDSLPVVVGSDPDAGIRLRDEHVSRRHASLLESQGALAVQDEGSTNGTFVNDRRVDQVTALRPGDRVRFATVEGVLEQPADAPAAPGPREQASPTTSESDLGGAAFDTPQQAPASAHGHDPSLAEVPGHQPRLDAADDTLAGDGWQPAQLRGPADHPGQAPQPGSAPSREPTAPAPERPAEGRRGRRARAAGIARGIERRSESAGNAQREVLTFRVERYDDAGNRLPPVPVELRALSISGVLSDNDEVEVTGRWRAGRILAHEIVNRSQGGARIGRRRLRGVELVGIAVVAFVMLSFAGFFIVPTLYAELFGLDTFGSPRELFTQMLRDITDRISGLFGR